MTKERTRMSMSLQEEYQKKMEAKIHEWNAKLEELKAKADQAQAETKIQLTQEVDSLRRKSKVAQEKLQQLKGAGEDAWEDLKSSVESAWSDMSQELDAIKAKLKS